MTQKQLYYVMPKPIGKDQLHSMLLLEKFNLTPPDVGALDWDCKLINTLGNAAATEERLSILISGVGGVRFFRVLAIQKKTAVQMSELWCLTPPQASQRLYQYPTTTRA